MVATVTKNAAKGTAAAPASSGCSSDCKPCSRVGLPILLVRPSVVDATHKTTLESAGYAFAPSFNADFGAIKREGTLPVARVMRQGYVYVLYEKKQVWDIWRTFSNGCTQLLARQIGIDAYTKRGPEFQSAKGEFACSQGASNLPANLITIADAANTSKVWLAFAEHLWTPGVLSAYAAGKQRSERMLPLETKAWIEQAQFPNKGALPLNQAALEHAVIEFAKASSAEVHPLHKVFIDSSVGLGDQRFGKAQALQSVVRSIESVSGEKLKDRALVLMLDDAIGVGEEHNQIRLIKLRAYLGWEAGGPDHRGMDADPKRAWKRQSAMQIAYLEEWAKNAIDVKTAADIKAAARSSMMRYTDYQGYLRTRPELIPKGSHWEADPKHKDWGYIVFPPSHYAEDEALVAKRRKNNKLERYRERYSHGEVQRFEKAFADGQKAWGALLLKLDKDYVTWLKQPVLRTAVDHDFQNDKALRTAGRKPLDVDRELRDATARAVQLEKLLGGGPITNISLQVMVEMLKKDRADPNNWFAQAALRDFDYIAELGKAGGASKVYDILKGSLENYVALKDAWSAWKNNGAQAVMSLRQTIQASLDQLQIAATNPGAAKALGISGSLAEVENLQTLWVKAGALHDFMAHGQETYALRVKVKAGVYLDALAEGIDASTVYRLEALPEGQSGKAQGRQRRAARASLKRLSGSPGWNRDVLVPVLVDRSVLENVQGRGRMVEVLSDNVLGVPRGVPSSLPEELVTRLISRQGGWSNLAQNKLPAVLSLGVLAMQLWALREALRDIGQKADLELSGALLAAGSAVSSSSASLLELAAIYWAGQPVPAGTVAETVSVASALRPLKLRFAAGMLGAGAGFFDAVAAWNSMQVASKKGNTGAKVAHFTTGFLFVGSAIASGFGTYLNYRAGVGTALRTTAMRSVNGQMTRVVVTRLIGGRLVGAGAAAALGASLTGVGLILMIVGFAWSLYAMSLEDDQVEVFLRRTPFGEAGEGVSRFADLDEEVAAFMALAKGVQLEAAWVDNYTTKDVIKVALTLPDWTAQSRLEYSLKSRAGKELAKGQYPGGAAPQLKQLTKEFKVHQLSMEVAVLEDMPERAARFSFKYWPDAEDESALAADSVMVEDGWW